VDTASYTILARHVREGRPVPSDAVRVEELINSFDYGYPVPDTLEGGFRPDIELAPSPWSEGRKLLRIGIKAFEVARDKRPKANLVVLLDVSGSMMSLDRLPLAKTSVCLLLDELRPDDTVALVTYAGATRVALGPTPAGEKAKILEVLDGLEAGGSTAGASGIDLAYAQANQALVTGGINRVLLATDGDFNVGISDPRRLKDLVERQRKSGITLTVLGFGLGNHKDTTMQTLAEAGNGQAAYIGTVADARRTMTRGIGGNLFTVATDTKFQVEFNPARVGEWRLVGYESRQLDRTDFDNDRVDAGDVGAGQSVTVLYELVPAGTKGDVPPLRYGDDKGREPVATARGDEYAFLRIRYKPASSEASRLIEVPIDSSREVSDLARASEATRFAVAVAWVGQILKRETAIDESGYPKALDLAKAAVGADPSGDRIEFLDFARKAKPGT
jgi:Ca-activated chloride channel family protein